MSTSIFAKATLTQPAAVPQNGYQDLVSDGTLQVSGTLWADDTVVNGERQFGLGTTAANAIPMAFWSDRVTAQVTISGTITFTIYGSRNATSLGRIRARLSKITAGGSNVESPIAQADASADLTTSSAAYTFTATPTSTVVVPGERFLLRLYAIPVTGSFGSTGDVINVQYGNTGLSNTLVTFTETVGFKANGAILNLRRTKGTGIGTYRDLLEAIGGSAAITGVVATEASGTEIVWTDNPLYPTTAALNVGINDTSNLAAYTSAAFTPLANTLYLLAVAHSDAASETTVPTIATTTGLNFVQVGSSIPFSTIAAPTQRLTLFRAMKASGLSNGTYTVNFTDAGTGCMAHLVSVTGALTTGTDGADAVANVSTNNNNASANPSITLGAFSHARNGVYACFGTTSTAGLATAGAGFTKLDDSGYITPTSTLITEWSRMNDTTADLTLASSAWAGIAVELVGDPVTVETLEFLSGRVKSPGFTLSDVLNVTTRVWMHESSSSANAAGRLKVFLRKPDGTETLVATRNTASELPTSATATTMTGTASLQQVTNFAEDDRVVVRCYITNVGTMAASFRATLYYDANSVGVGVTGNSYINLLDGPEFKLESDPAGTSRIPDGLPMTGVGN